MAQIDFVKAKIRKKNIEFFLENTDLTWDALAEGAKISIPTLRRVFDLKTNLSKSNQIKIEDFFGLPNGALDTIKQLEIPENNPEIPYQSFKKVNIGNPKFFKSISAETNAAEFVRIHLLSDEYFKVPRRKSQIIDKLKTFKNYNATFKDSAMAKEIERMYSEDKTIGISDPFNNKSVYLYYRIK